MKKFIIMAIAISFSAIVFNTIASPFISAYFQPDNMAFVNNQLSNDGAMSSAAIRAGMMPDTIIITIVNLLLLISFVIVTYKACKEYIPNSN